MFRAFFIFVSMAGCVLCAGQSPASPTGAAKTTVLQMATLPPTSLTNFPGVGDSRALETASRNGLRHTDLPSIGSGLACVGSNEFVGITDRGVNFIATNMAGQARRIFPLPQLAPAIVRFKINGDKIELLKIIPLHGHDGKLLTGLSNGDGEEACYESSESASPLAFDPGGVDPEGIRVLPDGRFLISEEYGPSVLVVSTNGEVLVRYTPADKPLKGAPYPVKPILPRVLSRRESNRGFECLALSADGKTAYAILQSPAGADSGARFKDARVSRTIRLDVSDPMNARVTGHFLMPLDAAADFPVPQKQHSVKLNDADWVGPDRLLVLEQAKGEARLLVADFTKATNLMEREDENTLVFEAAGAGFAKLHVQPASVDTWFSTAGIKAIDSDKLEGLAIIGPEEIALSNDNDFGVGENENGQPSMIWILRVSRPGW
jgi:hypothetical protein